MTTARPLFFLVLLGFAEPGLAYIGPGAGLGLIGSLIAVVVALILAIIGLVVLPLKLWARKRRAGHRSKNNNDDEPA
ncbi:MAG: hypothetical protein H6980_03330 [Gammaproteobacteria bacterium]|nr:hypothetical protein [Gammaproteobacteria bacterium]